MKPNTHALPAQDEQKDKSYKLGPQVSLTTAIEKRFVNTLVVRNGKPVHVPLTTNLGLEYKRRMLYFGELTLDTGALSSAIPEADLRKNRMLALSQLSKRTQLPTSKYW